MAFSKTYSGAMVGLETHLLEIEVNIDYQGFPGFKIVGLAAKEIDEAKERVRSAIKNSGFTFPPRRITVNLAPADLPKKGSLYDLPIAIGILAASGQIKTTNFKNKFFMGELSLDGTINSISGVIPLALFAKNKFEYLLVPNQNSHEAAITHDIKVKPCRNLKQLVDYLNRDKKIKSQSVQNINELITKHRNEQHFEVDFFDVGGQEYAKRALEIAIAGGHNVLIVGPPGSGKTLLIKAAKGIVPKLSSDEVLEVTKIHSISQELNNRPFIIERPFRSPHHSISKAGLIGGGVPVSPGEISLAHRGILFLDEFSELDRDKIESLRQPLEEAKITISRASGSVTFPANFTLIAATNPCPCGNLGHPNIECTCYSHQIKNYKEKLSGPILDRIDIHINCLPVQLNKLADNNRNEKTSQIKKRVFKARDFQTKRYKDSKYKVNSDLDSKGIKKYCNLSDPQKIYLENAAARLNLSARAYHKVIKVARSIADIQKEKEIKIQHLAESLQYRLQ